MISDKIFLIDQLILAIKILLKYLLNNILIVTWYPVFEDAF